ncbi:MAG TPA: acyl-CoA synthetase [Rhizobium sp.]|nr:acyl-CoA synthetase [Rhizobium sp.]
MADISGILRLEASGALDTLPASTYDMIRASAERHSNLPALSFFVTVDDHRRPERWTYGELLRDINRTANMFARMGASKDTVIAYILPNLPETHFVIWGAQTASIVLAINPLLERASIADLLNAAGATILVTLGPFPGTDLWQKVQPLLADVPSLRHVVLVGLADHVRGMKGIAATLMQKREQWRLHGFGGLAKAVPPHVRLHDFRRAMQAERGDKLLNPRTTGDDDPSSFFCTGGTTGAPKIAMRRHRNEVANASSSALFFGGSMGPGKVIFCGLPLFHVNGAMVTGLVPFSQGAHVLLGTPQGYRGKDVVRRFWEIVSFHRINFFSGVPTLYSSLLDVPIGENDVSSLEYGVCGAAPMPVEVFRTFQERTGLRILEGYGLTEGTCVSSVNPPAGERRLGSIGIRLPGQKMKAIILDEAGAYARDCGPDESGLIVISGPNVFAGYLQPEHDRGLWIDTGDGETWLNTGDLGRCDADGYFWLTGRKKDIIIRGGHNIDPSVIEEALHRHPDVQLAAAIGRPDAYAGEVPVAYVQLKPGAHCTADDLIAFANAAISERAAIPRHITIIEAMPLTGVGKIFKPELRKQEIAAVIGDELAKAGIRAGVQVEDAQARGVCVNVSVPDPSRHGDAAGIVGRFPFPFSIA